MKRLCVRGCLVVMAITLAMLLSLAACDLPEPEEYPAEGVAVFVVGNHANAPAPNVDALDAYLAKIVEKSVVATDVVCADGVPEEVGTFETLGSDARDDCSREDEVSYSVDYLKNRISSVVADDTEVNLLESIRLAVRLIDSYIEDNYEDNDQADVSKCIIVLDSGLSTVGLVDFTQDGMLAADGEDVASTLDDCDSLVDLEGVEVKWYFMGDVQAPQDTLSQADVAQLKDIWRAIIEAGGGTVKFKSNVPSAADNSRDDMEPDVTEVTGETSQPAIDEKAGAAASTSSEIKLEGDADECAFSE